MIPQVIGGGVKGQAFSSSPFSGWPLPLDLPLPHPSDWPLPLPRLGGDGVVRQQRRRRGQGGGADARQEVRKGLKAAKMAARGWAWLQNGGWGGRGFKMTDGRGFKMAVSVGDKNSKWLLLCG